ncbi:MAG: ArsR/SmtB family transcription factor [Candidatus Hydrothermarchaeaceae archaeon]
MTEDTNKVLAIYRMLLNDSNISILKELREEPKYILELEEKVGLDRVTIKRRLYVMVDLGLVETEAKKTPKGGRAVYYKLKNVELPSLDLFTIIDNSNNTTVREMSRVYRY